MKTKNFIFPTLLLLLLLSSCKDSKNEIKVDKNNIPIQKGQLYYPKKSFPKIEGYYVPNPENHVILASKIIEGQYDTIWSNYISEILFLAKEPLLFNLKTDKEIYRLVVSRSFAGDAIVTLEKENSEYKIYWKTVSFNSEYEPEKISKLKYKKISERNWNKIKIKLKELSFWNIYPNNNLPGNDGSTYILEGLKNGQYYVVKYWSPKRKEIKFYNFCEHILSLTDIK